MRKDTQWTTARVVAVATPCQDVREIVLDPGRASRPFTVGSHLDVRVRIGDAWHERSYSLVGEPAADGHYRIAVRAVPDSRGGSRAMWALAPGDQLDISSPNNHFALDETAEHIVLVAGGIGITPILGMAQRLARGRIPFQLLYAGRSRASMAYLEHLQDLLGERLQLFCPEHLGQLELAAQIAQWPRNADVYACGPLPLLDELRQRWRDDGRARARLHFETFGNSGNAPAQPFVVQVPALGKTVQVAENESLLDALSAAGVEVMADCRRGECGLCVVEVLEAAAPLDHRDVFLSDEQRHSNRKLCACVSRALGGSVSIDTGYRADAF
ncbi:MULTISPECIES: PDR/VanB family oxidoreductase [Xanthomonas]|uniref:PDR/VanB family oxidoreductase n=1 Tax=Xanthomonas TaxID=338 RepID=UPI001ADA138D|nr:MULTISPECIES: PDR/VanB family oxidoreductase [unclassified Xanthomonas]MBO9873390.1 oxidoreductase [Xanthomonas sp. D-93]WNH45175.1 PDR/VanB family oxidoreductase [Xanthomonas sp. A6251]